VNNEPEKCEKESQVDIQKKRTKLVFTVSPDIYSVDFVILNVFGFPIYLTSRKE
jgi:hypothetical protein